MNEHKRPREDAPAVRKKARVGPKSGAARELIEKVKVLSQTCVAEPFPESFSIFKKLQRLARVAAEGDGEMDTDDQGICGAK